MVRPLNKELLICFDEKACSSPDSDRDEPTTPVSNQLTLQNKFRGLERRVRNFETGILSILEMRSRLNILPQATKRSFASTQMPSKLAVVPNHASLARAENVTFISSLVKFFNQHLNGVGVIICESMLTEQLRKDPFDSILVLSSCALTYPVVMSLLSKPNFSPKHNPFYLRLKLKLSNSFEKPDAITLTALTSCCLLELGHGDSVPISLSIVKGTRLLLLSGMAQDVTIEELFSRNIKTLVHSFLWNFWENCKLLDAPHKKPKDDSYLEFTAQQFAQMHQLPDAQNPSDLFATCQMHIFNQQLFRQITFQQKKLTQKTPDYALIFSSSFRLFSKIKLAEPTIYAWIAALSGKDPRILQDKLFLAKAANAVTFLSLHILLLNLLSQIPKSPHDAQRLAKLPSILDISEKTLSALSSIEKRGQQIFLRNDPNLVNTICINFSIPYYYVALACLQDYSSQGYTVFYACLEKLKSLAPCWSVVGSWIHIIVSKRKSDLPLTSPPLALNNK